MTDAALFADIASWLDSNILISTALAAIGAVAVIAVLIALLILVLRLVASIFSASGKVSNARIRKAAQEPGFRIILGDIDGHNGGAASDLIEQAIRDHCSGFSFGAQFLLFRSHSPGGRPEGEVLVKARKRLERTGADMMLWGARVSDDNDGLRLFGVSRGGNLMPMQARPFVLALPGRMRQLEDVHGQAIAYLLAKRLQPALSQPEAFRDEKMAELGATLDTILDGLSEVAVPMPDDVRREIETDFSAIALHLADKQSRMDWLDKLIARRRATLEAVKGLAETEVQIDARLDLGRALIKRAEVAFDPVAVREASVHLNAAIGALRRHEVIRKAQRASDALARAQSLVETRRRFAVNFSA